MNKFMCVYVVKVKEKIIIIILVSKWEFIIVSSYLLICLYK